MGTRTWRDRRLAALALTTALLLSGLVGATGAGAHPGADSPRREGPSQGDETGPGVEVTDHDELAGFYPGVQWDGTAEIAEQQGRLVYAGTGCTAANYADVDVEGEIALVDSFQGQDPGDECPTYTYKQKMDAAEEAGAVGLVQISDAEAGPGNAIDSGIPGLEITNEDGVPLREAVRAGDEVPATLTIKGEELDLTQPLSDEPCVDGTAAGVFACDGVDLLSFVPMDEFDGAGQSDLWGWTDPETGDEYVIMGKLNGVGFFRVTDPTDPEYLGELPNRAALQLVWHDIKVHDGHAFIVSESEPHGMTVFDLTKLRGVTEPRQWERDAFYPVPFAAHNVEVNTETGFAYIVGGNFGLVAPDQCLSGLHIVDVGNPKQPTFAGCYAKDGGPGTLARAIGGPAEDLSPAAYVHDAQCVVYKGPDPDHRGDEVCLTAAERHVAIADVTDKLRTETIATVGYDHVGYTHQGRLTEDHRYFVLGDELDERERDEVTNTRSILIDVTDLDNPRVVGEHRFDTEAIDHNLYIKGRLAYHSNYSSGLRVTDTAPIAEGRLEEIAFFDTFPTHDDTTFDGTWSNYPFFDSGTIAVSGRQEGLFLLRLHEDRLPDTEPGAGRGRGAPFEVPPASPPPEHAEGRGR